MPTAKRSRAAIAAWSIALIGTVLLILSSVMQETAAAAAINWASWLIVRGACFGGRGRSLLIRNKLFRHLRPRC